MYDVYVAYEYKRGVQKEYSNPAVPQALIGRLLEIDRQGVNRFAVAENHRLLKEFVQNAGTLGLRALRASAVINSLGTRYRMQANDEERSV